MKFQGLLKSNLGGLLGAVLGATSMFFAMSGAHGAAAGPAMAVAAGEDDQQQIIQAVKHVEPSVVALEVTMNGTRVVPKDPFDMLFGPGFGGLNGSGEQLLPFKARASGSGFVVSDAGLIVTNDHVVHGASTVEVVFSNGDREPGHIYSEDATADLALVKVDHYAKLPAALSFGASKQVEQGEFALAIGEPYELKRTVTLGVVSGFDRDESIGGEGLPRQFKGLLQTSAPINPGNSGGPLVNIDGQVIGVNQSVAQPAQGIGFAIPADTVKTTVAMLEEHRGVKIGTNRGYLGVQVESLNEALRQQLDYRGQGVAVAGVVDGSGADKAGLMPGDVIQKIDGKAVSKPDDVVSIVQKIVPGKTVAMNVWSAGIRRLVEVKVGAPPDQS